MVWYGASSDDDADVKHTVQREDADGVQVAYRGEDVEFEFHLPLYGRHNVDNATGAATIMLRWGCTTEEITSAFASFRGVKRRMERKGQVGDALVLFDGRGGEYPARIDSIAKKSVTVVTAEYLGRELESPLVIHLGIAVSRGERMDWVVQKATELGVREITPLFTERTEVRTCRRSRRQKNAALATGRRQRL